MLLILKFKSEFLMSQTSIHPKQHQVTVQMTDKKTEFTIMTTWGKEGDILKLDTDPRNHPAWQEDSKGFINVNDERINKFNKKFGGYGNV